MEKEFVSYDQAVALKELGFDEPCIGWFMKINPLGKEFLPSIRFEKSLNQAECSIFGGENCLAPLKQQVFRWFRNKHNIDSHIEKYLSSEDAIEYFFMVSDEKSIDFESINFESHEEAESACIDKLIVLY